MAETLATELEAVNSMLEAIMEAPVNSIATDSLPAEVQTAVNTLRSVSRQVQKEGYCFNTDEDFELSRDINGYVYLPANTLSVDLTTENGQIDVVQRGLRLYDRKNHTYVFAMNPRVTLIQFLSWNELPEQARNYIKIRAARTFQDKVLQSDSTHAYTEQDEIRAKAEMEADDSRNSDYTIFDNYQSARTAGLTTRRPQQ